jgi:hypothetical protein
MKKLKYIPLCLFMLSIAVFFSSCSDQSWSVKTEKSSAPMGLYIFNEQMAYYEASQKIKQEKPSAKNVLKEKLEEKPANDWIRDKAIEKTKEDLATEELFDEMGLSLSEEETQTIDQQVDMNWKQQDKTLEKLGIGKESLRRSITIMKKHEKLFEATYGKEGTKAVTDEDLIKYHSENNTKYAYIEKPLSHEPEPAKKEEGTEEGAAEEAADSAPKEPTPFTEEEIAAVAAQFAGYVESLNKGAKIEDIAAKFKESEKSEEDPLITQTSKNDKISLPDEVKTKLSELEPGKAVAVKTEDDYYLVLRQDVTEESNKKVQDETERETLLKEMKTEDFDALIAERVQNMSFSVNSGGINGFPPSIFEPKKKKSSKTSY